MSPQNLRNLFLFRGSLRGLTQTLTPKSDHDRNEPEIYITINLYLASLATQI
jgi:hypothetical protein